MPSGTNTPLNDFRVSPSRSCQTVRVVPSGVTGTVHSPSGCPSRTAIVATASVTRPSAISNARDAFTFNTPRALRPDESRIGPVTGRLAMVYPLFSAMRRLRPAS